MRGMLTVIQVCLHRSNDMSSYFLLVGNPQPVRHNPVRMNRGKRMEKVEETSNIVANVNQRELPKRSLPDNIPDNNMAPTKKARPQPRRTRPVGSVNQVYFILYICLL